MEGRISHQNCPSKSDYPDNACTCGQYITCGQAAALQVYLLCTTVVHTCMYIYIYSHRKRWVNRALVLMVELRDIQFDERF